MWKAPHIYLWVSVRPLQSLRDEPGTWQTAGLINRKPVPVGLPLLSFVQVACFVASFNKSMALGVSDWCCDILIS